MTLSAAPYDKVMAHMGEHGIGLGRVYPSLMREQPAHFDYLSPADPTAAKAFVDSVINLPLYFGMTEAQIDEVVSRLEAFFNDLLLPHRRRVYGLQSFARHAQYGIVHQSDC